jgi:tetratricopeptide (TPR) repeat protein
VRDIKLPSSVRELVEARIAGLAEADRNILDMAACCGFDFDPLVVGAALGMGQIPVMRRLAFVEKAHRLVRSAGRRYVFDHHQVQESLYASIPDLLREPYHAAIAETMETRTKAAERDARSLDGSLAVDLARHFLLGARGDRALRYLDAALAHLTRGHHHAATADLARRALAAADLLQGDARLRVLLHVREALAAMGRYGEELPVLDESERVAEAAGDSAAVVDALSRRGFVLGAMGRGAEGVPHLERGLAIAREIGDRAREASIVGSLGTAALRTSDFRRARELQEERVRLCVGAGARREESLARCNLAHPLMALGLVEEARAQSEAAIAIAREVGDLAIEVFPHGNLGWALAALGRHEEACVEYGRQFDLARSLGLRGAEGYAASLMINACRVLGRFEESREWAERALVTARETDDAALEIGVQCQLATNAGAAGETAESLERFEQALAKAQRAGEMRYRVSILTNLGILYSTFGDLARGRETFEEARRAALELPSPHDLGFALQGLGWLAFLEGDRESALRLCGEALDLRRKLGEADTAAETLTSLATIEHAAGCADAAAAHAEEAASIAKRLSIADFEVLGRSIHAAIRPDTLPQALDVLARLERNVAITYRLDCRLWLWRATRDVAHLAEAKRILDHLRVRAPVKYRASMAEAVAPNREVMDAAWAAGL